MLSVQESLLVVLGIRVLGDKYTCFIGTDNKEIGKYVGEWVKKVLNGKGNVVELKGLMTSSPGQDRHNGFIEGLKGSNIKIVFNAETQWLEPIARKEMESALSRYNKIDLVFGGNDPAAHGAYLSAKAAGRNNEMMFVGIDGLPQEGQAYVKQGVLQASFLFPTGGREAVEKALDVLQGRKVQKDIMIKSKIFTKDNIDRGGQVLE